MTMRIVPEKDMPNQMNKSSICEKMEEWTEVLEILSTLPPGKGIEFVLSKRSMELLGGKDSHKHSYFCTALRKHFKNFKIPATAYARCVKRVVPK